MKCVLVDAGVQIGAERRSPGRSRDRRGRLAPSALGIVLISPSEKERTIRDQGSEIRDQGAVTSSFVSSPAVALARRASPSANAASRRVARLGCSDLLVPLAESEARNRDARTICEGDAIPGLFSCSGSRHGFLIFRALA